MSVETPKFVNVLSQFNKNDQYNFHPLEVVGRGSDAQLQVDGNLNYLI